MPEGRLQRTREVYDDRLIAVCPLCEEVLTADHDCEDARDDAEADLDKDLWGV